MGKKTIKKRKKKLPKNYNPDVDPDPERWLPKKERTGLKYMPGGYRKPRKDKRKPEKFTGAQGTDVGKSETFDYSGKLAASREAAGKQASPEPQAPASGPIAQQKCKRMRTRGRRREERSSSEWSFLPLRLPVFNIDCILPVLLGWECC